MIPRGTGHGGVGFPNHKDEGNEDEERKKERKRASERVCV